MAPKIAVLMILKSPSDSSFRIGETIFGTVKVETRSRRSQRDDLWDWREVWSKKCPSTIHFSLVVYHVQVIFRVTFAYPNMNRKHQLSIDTQIFQNAIDIRPKFSFDPREQLTRIIIMPRPKRAKVAPSAPAPRVRKPAKSTAQAAVAAQASKATPERLYDTSDPEEGAITSVRHIGKTNGKENAATLGSGRRVASQMTIRDSEERHQRNRTTENELNMEEARSELLHEIEQLSSSPAIEVGRRDRSTPAVEGSILAIGNFRRRPREPSILGRAAARARSSSVESNLAQDTGLTSVGRKNASSLDFGNFNRRQRKPSIIGRNAPHVAPSSMGLEMDVGTPANSGSALKIGNFKRRAREPSILRTAQKDRLLQSEYEDDDEDDFNPEDESTPLNLPKARGTTTSAATSSNPRKRKQSAVQIPQSSPTLPSLGDMIDKERIPATGPLSKEVDEGNCTASPREPPSRSIEARTPTLEPLSETMAPPHSSSSTPSSPEIALPTQPAPRRGRRTLRGRTPLPRTQDSPISSPPSLTHSPNIPVVATDKPKQRRQPAPPPSAFSTAQLQSLLPRRRRHGPRDPFDIASSEDEVDVSGLASDDDELSHLAVRVPPRRPGGILSRMPAPLKNALKSKAGPKAKPKESGGKVTYGSNRQTTSDKENEEEPDLDDSLGPLPDDSNGSPENSQELEKRVGMELKRAARKFEEVDKWELEFEEVTASSSSPRDGR